MRNTGSSPTQTHRLVGQTRSGVRAQSLRAANLSLVLRHILDSPGTATRSKVAHRAHITRATASRLVDELIDVGLVNELEPLSPGRGRPAVPLIPAPRHFLSLGLEANIGYLRACVVDLTGTVLAEDVRIDDFSDSDPTTTMGALGELARATLEKAGSHLTAPHHYMGSGLALPGLVSADALALAPNLGWRDIPLTQLLDPVRDLDVDIVANEADLAAFAVDTPQPGVASGPGSFIYVSVRWGSVPASSSTTGKFAAHTGGPARSDTSASTPPARCVRAARRAASRPISADAPSSVVPVWIPTTRWPTSSRPLNGAPTPHAKPSRWAAPQWVAPLQPSSTPSTSPW